MNTTRSEACALMYLLMRRNFEFAHHKCFTRVHLQVCLVTAVKLVVSSCHSSASANVLADMFHYLSEAVSELHSRYSFSALMLLVDDRKGIRCVELHDNPLSLVVDVSGWGTGCNILWQPHLPVSATKGATGVPRFTGKMAVKMVRIYYFVLINCVLFS